MQRFKLKKIWLYVMALLYIAAGINHFLHSSLYLSIMPPWLPYQLQLVYISGVFETLFGILLLSKTTRRMAAWAIIILLIAIYPANIQMSINYYKTNNPGFWITILRLPLQFVLIWWAYKYARKRNHAPTY